MRHIKDEIKDTLLELAEKIEKEEFKKSRKKDRKKDIYDFENKMKLLPLSEFIVLKATGQLKEKVSWYVDDMDLYMELFKYKNLDEACREIYETKIAKTKIRCDEEERKEEALKWIKGILKSLGE